jgi:predicted dehydrogenase
MMKKDVVNVCLIGAGRAGMIHAVNFKSRVPYARMAAIVEPAKETAAAACKELEINRCYTDYRQALESDDIDAVVIVTPTAYHREIALAAAKAGKHMLCEKPMAMDENECDDMMGAAEANKVKLQIGFMRRFDDSFMQAKQAIESGEIGDVVLVRSNTRGPSVPQRWMYDLKKSNGPLAEVNSHDIDTLRWFTGSEFKSVYAIGGNFRCPDAASEFPDFYDNVVLSAEFLNGMQGTLDGAQGVEYGYDARVEILGAKGCIYLGSVQQRSFAVCTKAKGLASPAVNSWRTLFKDAYLNEDIGFIECIREDSAPKVTGIDGKMAVGVVKAGNLSIKEKRVVNLI